MKLCNNNNMLSKLNKLSILLVILMFLPSMYATNHTINETNSTNSSTSSDRWQYSNVSTDNVLYLDLNQTFIIVLVLSIIFGSVLLAIFFETYLGSGMSLLFMSVMLIANGVNELIGFGLMLFSLYILSKYNK